MQLENANISFKQRVKDDTYRRMYADVTGAMTTAAMLVPKLGSHLGTFRGACEEALGGQAQFGLTYNTFMGYVCTTSNPTYTLALFFLGQA